MHLETFGALGREAEAFNKVIADFGEQYNSSFSREEILEQITFDVAKAIQTGNHKIIEKGFQQAHYSSNNSAADSGHHAYLENMFNVSQEPSQPLKKLPLRQQPTETKHHSKINITRKITNTRTTTSTTTSPATAIPARITIFFSNIKNTTSRTSPSTTTIIAVERKRQTLGSPQLLHRVSIANPLHQFSSSSHNTHIPNSTSQLMSLNSKSYTLNATPQSTSLRSQSFSPTSTSYSTTPGSYSQTPISQTSSYNNNKLQPFRSRNNKLMNAGANKPYVKNVSSPFNGNQPRNHSRQMLYKKHKFHSQSPISQYHNYRNNYTPIYPSSQSHNPPSSSNYKYRRSNSSLLSSPQSYDISSQSSIWWTPRLSAPSDYSSSTHLTSQNTQNTIVSPTYLPHTSRQIIFSKHLDDRRAPVIKGNPG